MAAVLQCGRGCRCQAVTYTRENQLYTATCAAMQLIICVIITLPSKPKAMTAKHLSCGNAPLTNEDHEVVVWQVAGALAQRAHLQVCCSMQQHKTNEQHH